MGCGSPGSADTFCGGNCIMKKAILLACSVVVVLAACAGTAFNWSQARSVTVDMTEKQLTDAMGKPYLVTTRGDQEIWVYSYASGLGVAKSVSYILQDGKVIGIPKIPDSFN
jgi:outer membrane protein assembly factor BamE (lipoprotein component of BamABCDE complex)